MMKDFFKKLFGSRKQRDQHRKLSSLLGVLSEPDGEHLAAGAERRIFFDQERGEFYSKVVESGGNSQSADAKEASAATYPPEPELVLETAEHLIVQNKGQSFQLSIHEKACEPEADDILIARADGREYLVHPREIYEQVMSREGRFLLDLDRSTLDQLKSNRALPVSLMDDSRNYRDLTISGMTIQVPCHYLGLKFFLFMVDHEMLVVTEHAQDENLNPVPRFLTRIDPGLVARTSARFDEEEEMWSHEEQPT